MKPVLKVLIVDDEQDLRLSLRTVLCSRITEFEIEVIEATHGKEAIDRVKEQPFDLVLMDVRMPEMDGLDALKAIKDIDPRTFVVIMTAHSNLTDAVKAIKLGAFDYIEKPVDADKLIHLFMKAVQTQDMVSSLSISGPIFDDDVDTQFVGSSEKMRSIFQLINKLAHVDTTVLVRGENGTGKELVARAIHSNSPMKHGPFVALNCGAIPENLMESELFGHEKGAFTGAVERKIGKFQMANKGTIFLDEIAELRPDLQVKLLRVLQEKRFTPVGSNREVRSNARIIAATNRNLEKMIEDGDFREDLFYRLNVMPIFLPPLRERLDDLEGLVAQFIAKFSKKHSTINRIDPDAMAILKNYRWPGNVRELENVIERAFIMETGPSISVSSLPEQVVQESQKRPAQVQIGQAYQGPLDYDQFKESAEKEFIESALRATGGRINKTVAFANIPKNTLLRKIKKYNIDVQGFTKG